MPKISKTGVRATPVRLRIVDLEGGLPEVHVGSVPSEVRVDKTVAWTKAPSSVGDLPEVLFGSADGRTLSMELRFDSAAAKDSVEPTIATLFAMAEIMDPGGAEEKRRPPRIALRWTGNTLPEVQGVIESLTARYTEFDATGIPVKATVAVRVREASRARFHRGG